MEENERRARVTAFAELYAQGLSFREIGERFGNISHQAVRQFLVTRPDLYWEAKRRRRELEEAQREQELNTRLLARMQRALDNNLVCVVCGCWILRNTSGGGNSRTCSKRCGADYSKAPWVFSEYAYAQHRLSVARTILRKPDEYEPHRVTWARMVLVGDDPGPNRRYMVPGSFPDRHPFARMVPFRPDSK